MKPIRLYLLLVILLAGAQGCTPSLRQTYLKTADRPQTAKQFFYELDRTIKKHKVENVVYASVPGFPYLRTDRFAAAIGNQLDSDQQNRDWVTLMKHQHLEARQAEVFALPPTAIATVFQSQNLAGPVTPEGLLEHTRSFANTMWQYDQNQPGYFETLKVSVEVPDDYSTLMRVFGLYPLAYLPVYYFSDKAYDKIRAWHQKPLTEVETLGEVIAYSADSSQKDTTFDPDNLFNTSNQNSLGLPKLSKTDEQNLALAFAPVIQQDTVDSYDRIGRFKWQDQLPDLDLDAPTVYYYITYGMKEKMRIIQINYAFWFTGRRGKKAPWFERGEFDGMTIRVSLNNQGKPFMVDVMNNCGCYHFFMPDASQVKAAIEKDFELDPLVTKWLPDRFPQSPLNVRINSGWHQVEHVSAMNAPVASVKYQLLPYRVLESLPLNQQQTVNLFDDEGIMKGSYRVEPYIFFSMGISKVGYMRQRGHHPVNMLGREHFDNPFIFNRNFTFN